MTNQQCNNDPLGELGLIRQFAGHTDDDRAGCFGESPRNNAVAITGMIGFDIACETARSGPRMRGYLVNALRKP